jgi:hypothetical protein
MLVIIICNQFLFFYPVDVQSLRCWHCIADDCDKDPSDNYKASGKLCNPGQSCQVCNPLRGDN